MPKWSYLVLILIIGILNVASIHWDYGVLRYVTEPLLMPVLIIWLLGYKPEKSKQFYYLLFALLFSWVGDISMMFNTELNLLFGISFFVSTHIIYILFFNNIFSTSKSYFRERPIFLLVVIVYLIEILYILWPYMEGLKIPVLIYSILLAFMMILALWQYKRIPNSSALAFISGTWLFVLSDTMHAIYKFRLPFYLGLELVQMTYFTGQFLIVYGFIKLTNSKNISHS